MKNLPFYYINKRFTHSNLKPTHGINDSTTKQKHVTIQ